MQQRDKVYLGGKWVPSAATGFIDVVSPSTEAVIGRVPAGGARDVDAAVRAARAAFPAWSATRPAERAAYLTRIHDGLKARADEVARTISMEVGTPLKMAQRIQAALPVQSFALCARLASEFQFEEQVGHSRVVREPVGVVACITPWNYPLHQIAAKVAPALAAGCTVVLKPSEVAPLNAFILTEIVHEAGLPAGVFNLVCGTGATVGEALVAHPDVDMVSFTGSTRAGRRISELAAATVKRVALELGGKSASIVLPDADLPAAVKTTVSVCFLNSGQTCNALTRLLVPESLYDEAARLASEAARTFTVGDPLAGEARLGPVVSMQQRERVRGYIHKGLEEGAQLLTGGADAPAGLPQGYYVQPTVLGRVRPDATVAQEEIFGPVLSIIAYRDEADAVRIANGTIYGLAAAVWSKNEQAAQRVAGQLRAGQVDINGAPFNINAPFGGYKQSGRGRELGKYGLEEFLEYKSIQTKPAQAA